MCPLPPTWAVSSSSKATMRGILELHSMKGTEMTYTAVYKTYVQFCQLIGVPPASFETWVSLAGK